MSRTWPAVFVHGSGLIGGPDAWPIQQEIAERRPVAFVTRLGYGPGEEPADTDFDVEARLVLDAVGDGAHLVSQSYGFAAAMQAAMMAPQRIRSLTLMEPAAFSLARGHASIEAHIAGVDRATSRTDLDLDDFFVEICAAAGIPGVALPLSDDQRLLALRWRRQPSAWFAPIDGRVASLVPTTVVTGHSSIQYEVIAQALIDRGATHRHILGYGHSVPRSPDANGLLESIFSRYDKDAA